MIDTHTHIYGEEFFEDDAQMVQRAIDAGVTKAYLPNVDESTIPQLLAFKQKFDSFCEIMMGIHPTSINADYKSELKAFDDYIDKYKYIAVGEIGIDLYWDKTYIAEQKIAFEYQIAAAIERNLPIVVHCRDAFAEVVDSLKRFDKSKLRGIMHSFSAVPDNAKQILQLGDFYFGIGGVSTYKNAKFTERLSEIPLSRIVLETDAPYLTPVPFRGKRNEPAYVKYVAEKLALLYGVSVEAIDNQTNINVNALFNIG